LQVTWHGRKLGNLGNFRPSLTTLFMLEPRADCYVIFQDDIEVAEGLRAWCDTQFWPQGAGLVSLYPCKIYHAETSGWRIVKPEKVTKLPRASVFRSVRFASEKGS
jgi:capsular polysaccharide biosynthesis protein